MMQILETSDKAFKAAIRQILQCAINILEIN